MTSIMGARTAGTYLVGMTTIDPSQTVAQVALRTPGAARTFERLGIDYCCRGQTQLREACEELSLPIADVVKQLVEGAQKDTPVSIPESDAKALIELILDRYHAFERAELSRLMPLAEKVARVHGAARPELERVHALLGALRDEILPHMRKEEMVLFPHVSLLALGSYVRPPFGTVENPVRMMSHEHERVGELMAELKRVANDFKTPSDACASYHALYEGLAELVADVHEHVHLENNVLFPLALALERAAAG